MIIRQIKVHFLLSYDRYIYIAIQTLYIIELYMLFTVFPLDNSRLIENVN